MYRHDVDALKADIAANGPLTSKDLDFVGNTATARTAAARLHGQLQIADMEHATPNPLVVHYVDKNGNKRVIDFLDRPHGIEKASTVYDTALSVEFLDASLAPSGERFRVIHPVVSMECRLANVVDLPKYQEPEGLRQARVSIICAHEFIKRVLDAGDLGAAEQLNERIFRFRTGKVERPLRHVGHEAAARFGLDAFNAVLVDPRLPERFRTFRYPQMQREIAKHDRRRGRGRSHGR